MWLGSLRNDLILNNTGKMRVISPFDLRSTSTSKARKVVSTDPGQVREGFAEF